MKRIFKIFTIALIAILITFTSCNDFLQEEPYGVLTAETSIKTPKDIRATVDAIYASLRNSVGRYSVWHINLLASEIGSTTLMGEENDMDVIKIAPSNRILDYTFQRSYQGIKRANTVVEIIDEISFNNDSEKNELLAEARFMRAFYYFNLVRLFGAVPMYMSVPKSSTEVYQPRTDSEVIYNEVIIPDLEFSIANLPDVNDDGRANKVAAQMILSKVYMTLGDWNNALNPIEKVINNQNYGLIANWADLWNDPNDNSEIVFAVQYIVDTEQKNTLSTFFGIGLIGMQSPIVFAELPFYNNYPEGPRKDALFLTEYVTPDGDTLHVDDPGWLLGRHFPIFKPYIYPAPEVRGTGVDVVLLRYADALLMYAEIFNELKNGPGQNALEALNKIRRRAAGYDMDAPSSVDLPSGLSQSEFRDYVFHERRWELPLEGHSWFDAVRCGLDKFKEVMAASEPASGEVNSNIGEQQLLMPFPAYEIQRNDAIDFSDQNPGY